MAVSVHHQRSGRPLSRLPDGAWVAHEDDHLVLEVQRVGVPRAMLAGERLPILDVRKEVGGFVSRFELVIRSWAGRARIRIESDGAPVDSVVLDIAPRADKLGETAYREMLEELVRVSKDLPWGFSPADHGAVRDSGSPAVVHPAVLESELPALLETLRRIRAEPLLWTERPRVLAPLSKNRQVDSTTFTWLLAHPRALDAVLGAEATSGVPPRKVFIEQRQSLTTRNHPATRALVFSVLRLSRALRASRDGLHKRPEPRAKELAAFLDAGIDEIHSVLRQSPFRDVEPEPPSESALLGLFDHPLYSRAHQLLHLLLAPGLRLSDEGSIEGSLRNSWDLFEQVVLHRLWRALCTFLGPSWSAKAPSFSGSTVLAGPQNGAVFRARGPDALELELHFQPTFASWPSEPRERWSLSGERRPDYVLVLRRARSVEAWVLLDAKYRASRSAVLEGLGDLHVYRDALRWNEMAAKGGFILVPALAEDARAFAEPSYLERFNFGALPVSAPGWVERILQALELEPSVLPVSERNASIA